MPYVLRTVLLLIALTAPVVFNPHAQAQAQAGCADELTEANDAYTFGRFDEAIALLRRCVRQGDASSLERQQAYRLLALSYIGKDDDRRARDNVRELLLVNPNYRPDTDQDPPPFIAMLREVQQDLAQNPPSPGERDGEKKGISKWVFIGGGAVLAGVAVALLAGGGDDGDGGGNGGPPQPTTLNEVEPNDLPAQAQVLRGTPPITVRGSAEIGEGSGFGRLDDFGNLLDEFEDIYRVTISQAGIRVTLSGLTSDGDIYLMDSNTFAFLGQSINAGTSNESINLPSQAAGTYLIAVSISDDSQEQGLPASTDYTLVVNATVSGASQRVAAENIARLGGTALTSTFRLMAHSGEAAPLGTVLPSPADVTWTAYHDDGRALVEYDATDTFYFRQGRGFWVQSDQPIAIKTPAPVVPQEDTFVLPLTEGWNIIANPFDVPMDWATVQAANGIRQSLWQWDGYFKPATSFESARQGTAYYYLNLSNQEALTIPHPQRARPSVHPAANHTTLTLTAYREGRPASRVEAGFAADAAPGIDGSDQFAPPGYFEATSLRLVRRLSSTHHVMLAREVQPWDDGGAQFDVLLEAPAHTPIELHADDLDALAGHTVYLIDPNQSTVYDLRTHPVVNVTSGEGQRRFILVVGDDAYAQDARAAYEPEDISISNYPNPFNPTTQISFALQQAETVRLTVFDVLGREVAVLLDGPLPAGTHEATFDAAQLPNGVYVYQLEAGTQRLTRTMLLMK